MCACVTRLHDNADAVGVIFVALLDDPRDLDDVLVLVLAKVLHDADLRLDHCQTIPLFATIGLLHPGQANFLQDGRWVRASRVQQGRSSHVTRVARCCMVRVRYATRTGGDTFTATRFAVFSWMP